MNSYRRYVPGSWAPTAVVWGEDNRTCGFRVVGHGAGRRVENIHINGQPVLPNLDIFVAAGGMNKALVKEFPGIAPDSHGNITIRTSAAPASPDQNAKICGIEILAE